MNFKALIGMVLILLFVGMLTLAFNIQPVKSDWTWTETVYIRADGSVEPDTAPISSVDNVTYTLTDNIVGDVPSYSSAIVVERDNIVVDGAGYILQGTQAWESNGIYLSGISNVTIKNTEIKSFLYGIRLRFSSDNTVSENNITAGFINGYGIELFSSFNNSISGNNMEKNGFGIHLWDSSNNTISENKLTDNVCVVWLETSSNNAISGNDMANNGYGIWLYRSSNNIIYASNIAGNRYGIELDRSNYNIISKNTIKNNVEGIWLRDSSNNIIYHNNFISNTYQAARTLVDISNNIWDDGYPSGGNYWSDHVCTGNPSDGSQPYIIDENNTDHYPFQDPNGWLLHQLTVDSSPITGITFTINGAPQTTPYTEWLPEGSYTLKMPETYNGYVWSHWLADGDTNRIKTITLHGTTYTAVYTEAPVGGYSLPINGYTTAKSLILYLAIVAILTVSFTMIKRRQLKVIV